MINHIEKGYGLIKALNQAGLPIENIDGVWQSNADHDLINQFIINYDGVERSKIEARARVTIEASKRVAIIYPFVDPTGEQALGLYDFATDLYLSIKPANRNALSGRLLDFKGIYDAAKAAIIVINSLTSQQEIDSYDAVNAPSWP